MATGITIGVSGKLYINTGTDAVPVYTLIDGQKNATVSPSNKTVDGTSKDDFGWETWVPTTRSLSIDIDGVVIETGVGYQALIAMFWAGGNATIKKFRFDTPGGHSITGSFVVDGVPTEYPYGELVTYKVTLKSNGACVFA